MYKNIAEVRTGDVIIDGSNRTTVSKVDLEICKNKVHINEKDCYENFVEVRVQEASPKNYEETGFGDLTEDYVSNDFYTKSFSRR